MCVHAFVCVCVCVCVKYGYVCVHVCVVCEGWIWGGCVREVYVCVWERERERERESGRESVWGFLCEALVDAFVVHHSFKILDSDLLRLKKTEELILDGHLSEDK